MVRAQGDGRSVRRELGPGMKRGLRPSLAWRDALAIFLPVRPSGPKEGVICAWGIDENGHRAVVAVRLGARESKEDWLELGRDLISRGLPAPRLVVADGVPGLISAVEEDLAQS
jgi:transposase-like protein